MIIAGLRTAPLLILACTYLNKGKGVSLVVLRKDIAKAHAYWLPSVEIMHRHDSTVGSVYRGQSSAILLELSEHIAQGSLNSSSFGVIHNENI